MFFKRTEYLDNVIASDLTGVQHRNAFLVLAESLRPRHTNHISVMLGIISHNRLDKLSLAIDSVLKLVTAQSLDSGSLLGKTKFIVAVSLLSTKG